MSGSMSPLLLLLLVLPLLANARLFGVPEFSMDVEINGNSVAYFARVRLNVSATDIDTNARFVVDTKAKVISLSSNSCTTAQTTKQRATGIWALVVGNSGIVADTADSFLGNIDILCRNSKNIKNVAALGQASTSLTSQLSKVGQIPLRFAYVLRNNAGSLFFGKTLWLQYLSFAPARTETVSFVQLPLKTDAAAYMVKLTGIGFKTLLTGQSEYVEVSIAQRYTTLPSKMYSSVLGQFQQEASKKKIKAATTSFGKLSRCYQMKSSDLASLQNLTMVFDGKSSWIVPGDKYLVPKTGAKDVYCLAFLEAAAGSSGVIGTLPQEDRAMDYNLEKKTLGVSLPLVGGLVSP